jgi:hypothetical protein
MEEAHNHPRFVKGRDMLALVVKLLLEENSLSHTDLQDLYRWACPDTPTWLSRSQISTLRNAKLPKPGAQIFLGLAAINLRLAQLAGDDSPMVQALEKRGPLPPNLARFRQEKPYFVVNPQTGMPLDEGDLFRLYCSSLEIDEEHWNRMKSLYSNRDAAQISTQLALWAQRWMVKQGLIPLEGRSQILDAYPNKESRKRDKLWEVILGQSKWTGEELREEADRLRFLIGTIERGTAFSIRDFDRWCRGEPV